MWPMPIQIRRWLKQAKVWSFVCFGSYAVGLLCYALSASSTHLLGKWTWWKILLYFTVSSIICLLYLFARRWQDSISSWLGAILVILVLTITCIYSFFSDQKMKEKPDVYILLSWAAFAIASLCLSKQINYGFEDDLLNFFCGGLIVLLMKINLWLVLVGVGFTRLLVSLGANLDAPQRSEHFHRSTSGHVIQIDPDSQFMDCIEALRKENQNLIGMVSKYVDKYIKASFESARTSPEDVDVNLVMDALPSGLINSLHEKVKLMVDAGFEEQCCDEYSRWRGEFLEEYISTFGLQEEDLNVENIIEKAESWERAFTVAVKILFPNEKRLLDRVFQEPSSTADTSFKEFCRQSLMPLLSFADALVMRNHSRDLMRYINAILRNQLRSGLEDFKEKFENQDSVRKCSKVLVLWHTLLLKIDMNQRTYSDNSYTSFSKESVSEKVMNDKRMSDDVSTLPLSIFGFQQIQRLELVKCPQVKYVFSMDVFCKSIPCLTSLCISGCDELEEIIFENGEPQNMSEVEVCFPNLQYIEVIKCNKLKTLFSSTIARKLPPLKSLTIIDAAQLEEVFRHKAENKENIVLPILESLSLIDLPILLDICQGTKLHANHTEIIACPKFAPISEYLPHMAVEESHDEQVSNQQV